MHANRIRRWLLCIILWIGTIVPVQAFDSVVDRPYTPFWQAHYRLPLYTGIAVTGLAAYEGTQSRLGKTAFQSLDATLLSQIATEGIKRATGRLRPRATPDPNRWFEGGKSFPSGHVSSTTALVTPFILEYGNDYPLTHLLWLFPIYEAEGRLRAHAHWQSDVLVGAAVGFVCGYVAHQRKTPLILYFDSDKVVVGLKYRFP